MKTKLLLLLALSSLSASAQSPIEMFYGSLSAIPTDGVDSRMGFLVTSDGTIDHTPSGTNQTWSFGNLSPSASSDYSNAAPTPAQLAEYPNTDMVVTNTVTSGETVTTSNLYLHNAGITSITGAETTGLVLNYESNNGAIGDFPLTYGYTNTDNTSGTYNYNDNEYSGNFSGTITTTVDGYGTLNYSHNGFPESYAVTRLKVVQNLSLDYEFFVNVGTVVQTSYHYYRASEGVFGYFPTWTTSVISISVPILDIDQTMTTHEVMNGALLLGGENFALQSKISVYPNPAQESVNIHADDTILIANVKITDINGRVVLNTPLAQDINVAQLHIGIYFAEITTDTGTTVKKFIKN